MEQFIITLKLEKTDIFFDFIIVKFRKIVILFHK